MNKHQMRGVIDAVHVLSDMLLGIDEGTFETFTCREIEILCDLLRVAGHDNVAAYVLGRHAIGDEEGDQHYYRMPRTDEAERIVLDRHQDEVSAETLRLTGEQEN
jgi:hypothetical protein